MTFAAKRGTAAALAPFVLLSACGGGAKQDSVQPQIRENDAAPAEQRTVACRAGPVGAMRPDCSLEWRGVDEAGRHMLVIRRAGGGFHRLLLGSDGRLGQADGAEPLRLVAQQGAVSDIAIGQDYFRLSQQQLVPPQ